MLHDGQGANGQARDEVGQGMVQQESVINNTFCPRVRLKRMKNISTAVLVSAEVAQSFDLIITQKNNQSLKHFFESRVVMEYLLQAGIADTVADFRMTKTRFSGVSPPSSPLKALGTRRIIRGNCTYTPSRKQSYKITW